MGGLSKNLLKVPEELSNSLTFYQGKKMSQHEVFTIEIGILVPFTNPSSPLERGTNENTNGCNTAIFS